MTLDGAGRVRGSKDYFSSHLEDMAPHRAILRAVESRFMGGVPLVRPVLDVGAGDGHFASIAYDEAIDVGIDPMARDLLEAAARRPRPYRSLVFASATAMPFRDETFNTVVSNSSIEHIPDLTATLREIGRVLRPDGSFVATFPSEHFPTLLLGSTLLRRRGFHAAARAYGRFFNRISHHYHVYPPEVWRERLRAAGLRVVEHFYYFSPEAHRAFDLSHYLGVPNLLAKRLLGRWVLHPLQMVPFEHWLRRYYDEPLPDRGAYHFVRCTKTR
ncbi:MAG: methyltransferase domain-containing protein [Chloroflexi bacterium]|nr:methyltransferase domain-containing protein [Chloroflexota bacterium]